MRTTPADSSRRPSPAVDARRHERLTLQAAVDVSAGEERRSAEIRDISVSGAFIATNEVTLSVGTGLRLAFALPQGFRVNAFGRIVWVRPKAGAAGPAGYGIQFYGLDDVNREFIEYHLQFAKHGQNTPVAGGRIETRFEVCEQGDNQIFIRMAGTLVPLEAENLEEAVCRKLAELKGSPLFAYIDVRDLGACSKASLDRVRAWLERLRGDRELLGVLVGGNSIGVVQVRRLAREAGIADSLMMFAAEREAREFWHNLIAEPPSRGPPA